MPTELPSVSYDTNVVSSVAAGSATGAAYLELIGPHRPALSYFVRGELRAGRRNRAREERLELLIQDAEWMPNPDEDLLQHYARANRTAHVLGLSRGVGEDLWMIAQTEQYEAAFTSHDRNAARVAKAMGLTVYTILPDIEADYAEDRARLERRPP